MTAGCAGRFSTVGPTAGVVFHTPSQPAAPEPRLTPGEIALVIAGTTVLLGVTTLVVLACIDSEDQGEACFEPVEDDDGWEAAVQARGEGAGRF